MTDYSKQNVEGAARRIITATVDAERMRAEESKLRRLLNSSIIGVVFWNTNGELLDANDLFLSMVGYTREELRQGQLNWRLLTPPEYVHIDEQALNQLLATGTCTPFEKEYIHKDGHRISVLIGSRLFEGQHDNGVSFVMDISERKQAETALRASEERYRELFENARDTVYVHNLDGRIVSVNRAAEKLSGYSREEIIGKHFSEFIEPTEVDRVSKSLTGKSAVSGGTGYEVNLVAKGGKLIPVEVSSRLIYENGVPVGVQGLVRDITERKRSELAVREAERKYREIFEHAGEGIFQSTPGGRYLAANPALARMLGFDSPAELIRNRNDIPHQTYVEPAQREDFKQLLERFGVVRGFEHQVYRKDGTKIWITVNARAVRDEDGAIVYYEGTAKEITERKLTEQHLREYERVVEGLEEMIVVVNRDYRYQLANRAFLTYHSKSSDEVLGHRAPEILGQEIFDRVVKKKLDKCFRGHVVKYEMRFSYPALGERDLFVCYFPIEGTAGIDRVACVLQDITEQKQAEAALRQSEERFSKAFHSSPAASSVALLESGILLEVNEAFLRMTGYEREEVIGKSTVDVGLWVDSRQRGTMTQMVVAHGTVADIEFVFRKKSGELRDGLLSVDLVELSGKTCVLGIAQDVTKRKRAESALRNYSRRLIEAQEAERQNIGRELHDQIGQVLTAIRINLQTIRKPCRSKTARTLIDEGTKMVDQAMEQVRDLSFELRPTLLDDLGLAAALRWYADRFAPRAGVNVTTAIKVPKAKARLPREFETACFRIVQEALTNVARHARAKNVFINLAILKDGISLSIKDDGIGFDERSLGTSSTHFLGLQGMKERALALGGKLEVNSICSEGTEILAFFPNGSKKKLIN